MSTLLTPVAGPQAVYRINPVAKLLTTAILSCAVMLSVDWVSATVALGCELLLLPWAGVGMRRLALRTAPVVLVAAFTALTILLYGRTSGVVHWQFLLARISDGSIELAVATALRVLAVGLPAVVLFLTIDPTDLADGLAQVLRLPSRFVIGALAGLRLVGLFLDDWRALELARRARGLADRNRLRRLVSQAFALLVLSIRRGSKLATAMEARGFGGPTPRTWARPSRFGQAEFLLVLIGVIIAVAAVGTSVASGHWRFLGA